jgi:hypothetical protein
MNCFFLFPDFPSEQVYMAYLNPSVDNSTEKFTWAIPNLVAVRDYAGKFFFKDTWYFLLTH